MASRSNGTDVERASRASDGMLPYMTEQKSTPDFRSVLASVGHDGRRRWIYAHIVSGLWRTLRGWVALLMIGIYCALPFITIGGKPMLLIDLPGRRYVIAGASFGPQDLWYLLLFVLLGVVLTLLTVALVGRFFCGWLCPHNIFLEVVYRPLEALFEGPAHRRALHDRNGSPGLWWRKGLKWTTWIVVTAALANSMTAIFTGTADFHWGLIVNPVDHPGALILFAVFFGLVLINFAWFREQMCTIFCPYGRLQSVMLDPHSLVVAYDPRRGEPRGKPGRINTGDCVDCGLCVKVCPTGIDIRNGNQMECIHCAACVDACDTVMIKLDRPTGLIAYRSESELAGGKRQVVRPRTVLYGVVLVALLGVIGWSLAHRDVLIITQLRSSPPAVAFVDEAGTEQVRQVHPLKLTNRSDEPLTVTMSLPPDLGARIRLADERIVLAPGQATEITVIIDVPKSRFAGKDLRVDLVVSAGQDQHSTLPITLHCP